MKQTVLGNSRLLRLAGTLPAKTGALQQEHCSSGGHGRHSISTALTMPIDASTALREIFLVEDDDGLRALEAKVLSGLPAVGVRQFERAEEALDRFSTVPPALLICDLGLPGMSGAELVARVRSRFPVIPVLVTTGNQYEFDRQLRRLPFVELWEKPFSLQDLRDRVHEVLAVEAAAKPKIDSGVFSPFDIVDYLQMASFGCRDLVLHVRLGDGRDGRLEIFGGEIWSCQLGDLRNLEALQEILEHREATLEFRPVTRTPPERELTSSTSGLLLELAAARDEARLPA